jgi:hypothetical protein
VADCTPADEDGRAACDIYMPQLFGFGGCSSVGLGRILFSPAATGSTATVIVGRGARQQLFDAWTQMLQGRAAELCP